MLTAPSGTWDRALSCDPRGLSLPDVNECNSSPCSQECANVYGSYQCYCRRGYQLSDVDGATCEGEGAVPFSPSCRTPFQAGSGLFFPTTEMHLSTLHLPQRVRFGKEQSHSPRFSLIYTSRR